MRIVWTPQAQRDLDAAFDYIVQHNPTVARALYRRIRERVRGLAQHPHSGRPGREPGTRELVITGTLYLVPYRVTAREIQILAVIPRRAAPAGRSVAETADGAVCGGRRRPRPHATRPPTGARA